MLKQPNCQLSITKNQLSITNYQLSILSVLAEAGEGGISVQSVIRHVYNMNCTLFAQPDLQAIQTYVRGFLLRNSRTPKSLIAKTGRRGYYKLNTAANAKARQIVSDFRRKHQEEDTLKEDKPQPDLSLSLF